MSRSFIALVGDYSLNVQAHIAIPKALELARATNGGNFHWRWFETKNLDDSFDEIAECAGLWVAPGSPYANMPGVLEAIRWAREKGRPFLGTCGGFQHALIEFARNVAGLADADHAETSPDAKTLLVTRLTCSLVEKTATVRFVEGSRLREAYAADEANEGYRCNYGLNTAYRQTLENAGLRFTAFDEDGAIRGAELRDHPFFVGTLFQPERAAQRGQLPPLVKAFLEATQASITQQSASSGRQK